MRPLLRLHDGMEGTSPELREDVAALQKLLVDRGFPVNVDGLFGDGTEAAVEDFQRAHELADDGVVGPRTWAALEGQPPPDANAVAFPTTRSPNDPGLTKELAEAEKYRAAATAAAGKYEIPLCILAGIGSRESGWGLLLKPPGPAGTGDFAPRKPNAKRGALPPDGGGYGRGLIQIDYDGHEFARTGDWRDPLANLTYGAGLLSQFRATLARANSLAGTDLWRGSLAAYNCGPGNVQRALRDGRDLDFYTANRNYGADTLNRAGWFLRKGWTS
jgi:Putative peptidoglycan binding domain/Transglycosylase SLT domain